MFSLHVQLFGCPRVSHDGVNWQCQATRSADLLLAMLVLQGPRLQAREKLAAQLWPDAIPHHSKGALRTTLWRLRHTLEPAWVPKGTFLQITARGELGLNRDANLHCDVLTFEKATSAHVTSEIGFSLRPAPLMESFYDDWLIVERERLRDLQTHALILMMEAAVERRDWRQARDLGQHVLAVDPLRESVHRTIIFACNKLGNSTQALRQYQLCSALLAKELNIEPMAETRALISEIALTRRPSQSGAATANPTDLSAALLEIDRALSRLREVRRNLVSPVSIHADSASPDL